MDERLKLTDEQNALIDELENLIKRMDNAKIGFLQDDMGQYSFYNANDVLDVSWANDDDFGALFAIDECRRADIGGLFLTLSDTHMTVQFKD